MNVPLSTSLHTAPENELLIPTVRVGIFHSPATEARLTAEMVNMARWRQHDAEISVAQQAICPEHRLIMDLHQNDLFINQFVFTESWEHTWTAMMAYVTHALVFVSPDDTDFIAWLKCEQRPRRLTLTHHL